MAPLHGLPWNKKNANEDGVYVAEAFCVGTGSCLLSESLHKDGDEESLVSGLACDLVSPTYIPTAFPHEDVSPCRTDCHRLPVLRCPLLGEGGMGESLSESASRPAGELL